MRGKEEEVPIGTLRNRITPAHAGKSQGVCNAAWLEKDHPRACGEKPPDLDGSEATQGSPPRMRGKESRCL